jgi:DNA replication protein DnaC
MLHNPVSAAEKKITNSNGIKMTNSGTGKTHIMIGLAQIAIDKGYKVRYYTAAKLAMKSWKLKMKEDFYNWRRHGYQRI